MKSRIKILVIGGTGFLGFHTCLASLKRKWDVTSISSKKPKKSRFLKNVDYLICDIRKKNLIDRTIKNLNYDYVINFGGYVDHKNKKKTFESHYKGCKNLADHFQKKKIKSFIQIGSCIEYGKLKSPQIEKKNVLPKKISSVYGKSKLMATNYLLKLFTKYNFPVTILRLYLVYGPYQDLNRFLPITINGCLNNAKFDTSSGIQKRDFLYVSDFISLVFKVLKSKNSKGEIFNVGSGKPKKIKNVIKIIRQKIKKGNPNYGKLKLRKDEILNLYPSIKKAKKILKWSPKIKFQNGLSKTIRYYKD